MVKKSKEGSTLIVTIILFMFVTTVSAAFLSMITSNYYGRLSESKRAQNLYSSESGLDTTYNVIVKTVEAASFYGNEKVKQLEKAKDLKFSDYKNLTDEDQKALYALYADIEYLKSQDTIDENKIKEDNDDIDKLINKVFKNGFKEFMYNNLQTSIEKNQYIKFDENNDTMEQEVLNGENAKIYFGKKSADTSSQEDVNSETNTSTNDMIIPKPQGSTAEVKRTLKVESGYDDNGEIIYEEYPLNFSLYNKEEYSLIITSEFQTDSDIENTIGVGENLRVVEANYSIRVPNYNEVAFKESSNIDDNINELVGLTIGGDLNIKGAKKLNVTGNIFVQGNEFNGSINNDNRTFVKYSGGIILNNDSETKNTINFNDNVFTRGTFSLKNNVGALIKGDLYARNIYAGDENNLSDNSTLTVNKETVTDNDLTVKATNTQINITDFYGINDITVDEGTKVRKSSSIIINDYKDDKNAKKLPSSVTISNKAYIMGVAHINTEDGYQTGESVAVNGNYKAYSVPDSSGTEKFKYDDPLQVLDTDDPLKKIDHFYNYWKDKLTGDGSIDCGGVILPKDTYSVGAVVYEEKDGNNNITKHIAKFSEPSPTVNDNINKRRLSYARNVYTLGRTNIDDSEAQNLYNLIGNNAETVSDLLKNFSNLTDDDYEFKGNTSYKNNGQKMAIFAPQEKTIVIKGESPTSTDYTGNNYVVIDATSNKDVNAAIVTAGDVIIDGEVNFRGNIIAQKDLTIEKNSVVNIYYDKNITKDVQRGNGVIFNKVFGDNFGGEELSDDKLTIQSNSSAFVKDKLWKIIH